MSEAGGGHVRVLSAGLDTSSSASRQHYIDTGRYLTYAEVAEARGDTLIWVQVAVHPSVTPDEAFHSIFNAVEDEVAGVRVLNYSTVEVT